MSTENKKPSQEDLLKAVADVLDTAIKEYEELQKGMAAQEQPSQPEGIDAAQVVNDPSKGTIAKEDPEAPAPAPEKEDGKEDEDEDEEEKKKRLEAEAAKDKEAPEAQPEGDEKLMETYKSMTAEMEKRGLLKKSEPEAPKAPETKVEEPKTDEFKKSVNDRFENLDKKINEIVEAVKKIGSQPQARKGLAGYKPLMKSEGATEQPLKKSEVVSALLAKKAKGERIDTSLINRVETGRLAKHDMESLKTLGILG